MTLDSSIEANGMRWLSQAAFWARAVTVFSLLAAAVMLLPSDWNAIGFPPEALLALALAAPAMVYFILSFFVGRAHGNSCGILAALAGVHIVGLAAAVTLGVGDDIVLYLILAIGLASGLGNLIVSAFWARRWIRQPLFLSGRERGFQVLAPGPAAGQSIAIDREK